MIESRGILEKFEDCLQGREPRLQKIVVMGLPLLTTTAN